MRTLYGPTSWRRVLALALVFVMMFSIMGTSGYSVFAEEDLPEASEEVIEAPAEEVPEAPEEVVIGESPGEEEPGAPAEEPAEEAEPAAEEEALPEEELSEDPTEAEEAVAEGEEDTEAVEEEAEDAEAEPAEEGEEAADPEEAEAVEEESEEEAEEAEETEIVEEAEEGEAEEEPAEAEEPAEEDTLIAEAAQVIMNDDGSEAPAEEAEAVEEAVEEAAEPAEVEEEVAEEAAGSVVGEFVKGIEAEPVEEPAEEVAEPVEEAEAEEFIEAIPEEVAEEPEIAYPAKKFRDIIGGISVAVDAPEGAFPEGTEMKLAEVEIETIIDAVADAVEGEIAKIKAVDITFFYEGEEIQPLLPISVAMNASGMTADSERQVLHISDEGEASVVEDADTSKKAVEFEADSFSVYVLVSTVVPRLAIIFNIGAGEDNPTMYVKAADTAAEVDRIVYDPGVGTLPDNQFFRGWSTDENYTINSTFVDIAKIRSDAMTTVAGLSADSSVTYYPAVFKQLQVNYVDDFDISVGSAAVLIPVRDTEASYTVNQGYSTDDTHNFEGWLVEDDDSRDSIKDATYDGNAIDITDPDALYPNGTIMTITGDVEFTVSAPEGHWLVFDENGKGATYKAPRFIKNGQITDETGMNEMVRNGYSFVGWFYGTATEEEDPLSGDKVKIVTYGDPFEFGHELTENTTIYAKWQASDTAGYTIIFWTQNLNRTGYEVAGSYAGSGNVDENIPYESIDNDDEDYASGAFGNGQLSTDVSAPEYLKVPGHYRGFCLTDDSKNQTVKIAPEGDSVLNLYYDRIEYNFKFYLYRDSGTNNNRYTYANNSGTGATLDTLVTWHNASNNHPTADYDLEHETVRIGNTDYEYYYFVLSAYYGQDISEDWPVYSKLHGVGNNQPVSYVMMVGTKLKPRATSSGSGTVKGIITVMNENILGHTELANDNYVIVRFPNNYNNWRYHIWFEALDNVDYDAPMQTYGTKQYYEETVVTVRSSNLEIDSQNEPKYTGFDFIEKKGQNWNATNVAYWTSVDEETGETLYHLNYIYDRQQYKISYFDGNYVDGNGNRIQNRASHILHESGDISQGATIPDEYVNYKPALPAGEAGYVFEGWYLDEGCTTEYDFTTMPVGGIEVYAKWRQIQYRVFLDPQAGTDPSLSWGKDPEGNEIPRQMNFRVSFGGKISVPDGTRKGYEFFGWYTDRECTNAYTVSTVLNETTVTGASTAYNKATDMTDNMDRWGQIEEDSPSPEDTSGPGYNSDAYEYENGVFTPRDRFWITKKLVLYAKWSEIIIGAPGISVTYDANGGSNPPTDPSLYKDSAFVSSGAAPTAPTVDGKTMIFDHWVLQTWDGSKFTDTTTTVLPGGTFKILKSDAKITDTAGAVIDPEDVVEGGTYNYEVQLKAAYKDPGEAVPTYIKWFKNDGTEDTYRVDDPIQINLGVDIFGLGENESTPSRTGYIFKGWTKTKGGTTADFLVWTGSEYKTSGENGVTATQVAADEKQIEGKLEDLFAVWEADDVGYTVEFYYQGLDGEYTEDTSLKDTTRKAKTDSPVAVTDADKAQTKDGKYVLVTGAPSVLSADAVAGDESTVLKLYFDLAKATVTVEHYLLGENTAFKTDTVADQTVTSTYTATPETAYQGKDLTVDSYDPSQTITVAAEDPTAVTNLIKIYYTLPLEIEGAELSKVYDGKPLTGEYTITGAFADDEAAIKAAIGTAPSVTDVTEKAVSYQAVTDGIPAYYTIAKNTAGSLEVTKATITVNDTTSKPYNGEDQTFTISADKATGVVDGETLTLRNAMITGKEPGDYTEVSQYGWYVENANGDDSTGNYDITVTGRLTIIGETHVTIDKETVDKPSNDYEYKLGEKIKYTITVTNDGSLPVGDFKVVDKFTGDTWEIDTLAVGRSEEFTAEHVVTEDDIIAGKVINEATVEGLPEDEFTPDKTEDKTEPKNPHLTVVKETTNKPENNQPYAVGDTIEYKITVTNDGNVTISGVKVTDELTGDEWAIEKDLAPGDSQTFTAEYKVTEADAKAGKVINEATATGKDPEGEDPDVTPGTTEDPVEPPAPVEEKVTILYNSNYSSYSTEADKTGTDGPAETLTILSPDDAKLKFAEKDGEDLIWKSGDKTFKFIGWTTERKGGTSYEVGSVYPKADGGAVQAATSSIRSFLRMAGSSSEGTTADAAPNLTLYAQWEYIHLTVTKETTSTPNNGEYYVKDEVVEYKITVENDGTVDISDIEVIDKLEGVKPAAGESMKIDVLKAGEKKEIKVTYTVADKDVEAGKVTNEATAKAIIPDTKDEVPVTPGTKEVPTGETPVPGPNPPTPRDRDNDGPDEPIEDPDTPLAPAEEEPDEPISDGPTPLAPYEEEPDEPIEEEPTPFSPYTGDDRHTAVWGFVSLLSLAGIAVVAKKRREEE